MYQGKRISQILFIIVLCVFILYAGFHLNLGVSDEMTVYFNSFFLHHAEKTYLSGLSYTSQGGGPLPEQWVAECAARLLPLGSYVSENAPLDMEVEEEKNEPLVESEKDESTVEIENLEKIKETEKLKEDVEKKDQPVEDKKKENATTLIV